MRRRKKPGALGKYLEYKGNIIEINDEKKKKVDDFVGNSRLELELGSGCSGFSIEHAKRRPEIKFLAFEYKEELLLKALETEGTVELDNLKFVRVNIEEIESIVEQASVDVIYLNFSDPWPKKRHTNRRLTSMKFLEIYKRILKPGGRIEFKTDFPDFFEFSLLEFEKAGFAEEAKTYDLHADEKDVIMTEYEKKFVSQGKKIMYVREVMKC